MVPKAGKFKPTNLRKEEQFFVLKYRIFNFRILCLSHLADCLGVRVINTNLKSNHRQQQQERVTLGNF